MRMCEVRIFPSRDFLVQALAASLHGEHGMSLLAVPSDIEKKQLVTAKNPLTPISRTAFRPSASTHEKYQRSESEKELAPSSQPTLESFASSPPAVSFAAGQVLGGSGVRSGVQLTAEELRRARLRSFARLLNQPL
jgi:hypothetical protein